MLFIRYFPLKPVPRRLLAALALAGGLLPVLSRADTAAAPAGFDIERANSSWLRQIHADLAQARGITGKGVTIAILDSGISTGHAEFRQPGRLLPGFNAADGSADITDRAGHGSHVAGIIGAGRDGRGTLGIAYDATLLPVKVFLDSGGGSTGMLDNGLRYAIGKARIVNMSLAAGGVYAPQAMQQAVQAGMLLVTAAGNDGAANPDWPARFSREAWANNQVIAVGAVDAHNRIAAFSNRAGDAAPWFLVAPGVGILSAYKDGRYATMSGTSMAAPMVSGAAALVMQLWPWLRADQVADILFVTATDLGAPGIDPIYGRGMLNVDKALRPIGSLTTTTFNGRSISVLAGSVQPSAATSRLWTLAASGQLRVVGLDDFRRDFDVDLGRQVTRPATLSLDDVLPGMNRRIEVAEQVLADGSRIMAAYDDAPTAGDGLRRRLSAFSLRMQAADGREMGLGFGGMAQEYFGAGGLRLAGAPALSQVASLSDPYFALLPGAAHAVVAQHLGGLKLSLGVLGTGLNPMLVSQQACTPMPTLLPQANAGRFEVSTAFDSAALSLSVSQTQETNAYLGASSSGALALGDHATTTSVQLAGALLLAPKIVLAGQAAWGITPSSTVSDSLITEITAMRTNAFSLALVASDRLRAGDRFSMSISQPMRAYAGHIAMDVLSAVDDGAPTRDRLQFSMVPLGRELRAEFNYQAPAGPLASLGVSLMLRRNPNNLADADMEKLLALRYGRQF